jgi:hypothetical protein
MADMLLAKEQCERAIAIGLTMATQTARGDGREQFTPFAPATHRHMND